MNYSPWAVSSQLLFSRASSSEVDQRIKIRWFPGSVTIWCSYIVRALSTIHSTSSSSRLVRANDRYSRFRVFAITLDKTVQYNVQRCIDSVRNYATEVERFQRHNLWSLSLSGWVSQTLWVAWETIRHLLQTCCDRIQEEDFHDDCAKCLSNWSYQVCPSYLWLWLYKIFRSRHSDRKRIFLHSVKSRSRTHTSDTLYRRAMILTFRHRCWTSKYSSPCLSYTHRRCCLHTRCKCRRDAEISWRISRGVSQESWRELSCIFFSVFVLSSVSFVILSISGAWLRVIWDIPRW